MERTANCITLEHPKQGRRQLRFVCEGRSVHATGGVWGEPDWFETLGPATKILPTLAVRVQQYLAQGFVVQRVRIHDRAAAAALGFGPVPKPPAIRRARTAVLSRGQERATALLAEPVPTTRAGLRTQLARAKAVYLEPLGRALRQQVRARLDQLQDAQERLAPSAPRAGTRRRQP